MPFCHLHLHSQYSLLDGAIRLGDLFPRLQQYKMNAVALTDHGNMFGAVDFFEKARAAGVKPIFGCEVYLTRDMHDRTGGRDTHHLILLAKNLEGYRNLAYMVSRAYLDGFYYTPRIDKKLLAERRAGLFGLTACLGGEVPQAILTRGTARAAEVVKEYKAIFEPNSFFLELQDNGLAEQRQVNDELVKLSRQLDVGLVATNDCHYLERKDARAHDILLCIQTGKTIDDPGRMRHETDEFYLKSPEEMEAAFQHLPQALENAAAIAEQCEVELDFSKTYLPRYQVPEGHDLVSFLRERAREGLERRFVEAEQRGAPVDRDAYRARLEHELDVIVQMGFPGYFLVVWDFISFAKSRGIPVGPGRGSGAGSLAAYALRITDLDPIPYHLLFERFLNPERVSMPDFDVDFCMNRRDEVIRYVTEKYGHDKVGQIATFHSLKARGVVRDVARVMGLSYADGDRVAKLIPEPVQGKSVSIPQALQQEPRLRELAQSDAKVAEMLEIASALEGLNRHVGLHAAGLVISEKPLWDYVPCFRGQNNEIVTQFAKDQVEHVGLVKFDFLGLTTLTILKHACALVEETTGNRLDLAALPLDDAATFEMIQSGNTTGVFQLESSGFKELLKRLKPDRFEDIIAAVALYRPGPLEGGMVDDFIKCKHGQKKVHYPHPLLEPVLRETHGVIVYQEQAMQIASALAGFTLGQADILRRAMGKKKPEEMAKLKRTFLEGAAGKSIEARVAEEVYELIVKFAGYGFNKSHSAAYAVLTYQTAYLKCHFPEEFMAAVLTCEKDDTDRLARYIAETRAMGITVARPDVNESESYFSVVKDAEGKKFIRFGLSAVRNVGEASVEAMIEVRRQRPFSGMFDFCERVDAKRVNKRVLEFLVKSGAFDGVAEPRGISRARLMAALDAAQERAAAAQRDRESGQTSLFGALEEAGRTEGASEVGEDLQKYPEVPDWEPRQRLAFEKEALGFYVSGHPLDRYEDDLRRHAGTTTAKLESLPDRTEVSIGGLVTEYRERPLKNGKGRMALFNLEDKEGSVEVVVFSRPFEEFEATLKADDPLLVTGTVRFEGEGEGREGKVARLHLRSAVTLPALRRQKTREMHLHLDANRVGREQLEQLKQILLQHVGECRTLVHLSIPSRSQTRLVLSERYSVTPSDELLLKLERLFGERVAVLR